MYDRIRCCTSIAFFVLISTVRGSDPLTTERIENPLRESPPTVTTPVESVPISSGPPVAEANESAVEGTPEPAVNPQTPAVSPADPPPTPVDPTPLSRERIEQTIKSLQENKTSDPTVVAELTKRYQAALDWLNNADDSARKTIQYESESNQSADLIRDAREKLDRFPADAPLELPPDQTLPQLEAKLTELKSLQNDAHQRFVQSEEQIKRRGERKTELAKLIEETKKRLDEAEKQLAAAPPAGESPEMASARRTEIEARVLALRNQTALYKAESNRLDALVELFPLNRDLAKRQKNSQEKLVASLETEIARFRKIESERQAAEARRQVGMAHPALRTLAENNAIYAERRKTISERISRVSSEVKELETLLDDLKIEFGRAEDKVSKAGHTTTVGLMLRKQREELPDRRECQRRIEFVSREMPIANLDRLQLEEDRAPLGDMDAATAHVIASLGDEPIGVADVYLQQMVNELLLSRRDLMDKLVADLDAYLVDLSELEVINRRLIEETDQFAGFIDEHVLWIRSSDAVTISDVTAAGSGLWMLADPSPWVDLLTKSGVDTLRRPVMAACVLIVVLSLIAFQARLRWRVNQLCDAKSNSAGTKFRPTVEAIGLTAILAAEWPVLVFYFGWRMTKADVTSTLGLAVGPTLQYLAIMGWLSNFLRLMNKPEGVGATFLGASSHALTVARRELRWLTYLAVPLASVVVFAQTYGEGQYAASLGRIAFIGAMLVLASSAHCILGSKDHILREAISRESTGWFRRVRVVAYFVTVSVPATLAVLAAVGYYYSAQQLAIRLQTTIGLVLAILLAHSIAARWSLVRRRSLALQQAKERQARANEAASDTDRFPATRPVVAVPDHEPDLSAIHEKLQLLLRHATTVMILACIWVVWSDVLPALKVLDHVVFWEKTVDVTVMHEDASGSLVPQQVPHTVRTTLRHGLIAAATLLATFALGKNLPALLELTLLNRLPVDRGARHAISVILHYGVALTGVFLACRTLNITWTSIQWLAAGMTVGLGFGLQEIFANFVAGMILLFERPIRVGDVITLADVTGTVTNIRIRATTVTNWDRKELIVPNKELITGRLLNWTLSDTTNRIVINVGLAYRTNTQEARELMLGIVTSHPNVLEDPAPNVTFEGFGDSTLTFVIRAYVASMEVRLDTIHELHTQLNDELKKANIEIAFPQRDINVRYMAQGIFSKSIDDVNDKSNRSAA